LRWDLALQVFFAQAGLELQTFDLSILHSLG
jgi:hypothetical protein